MRRVMARLTVAIVAPSMCTLCPTVQSFYAMTMQRTYAMNATGHAGLSADPGGALWLPKPIYVAAWVVLALCQLAVTTLMLRNGSAPIPTVAPSLA